MESSPVAHFNLFTNGDSPKKQHTEWYCEIRSKVWERISFEDQLPPSIEALELHWLRTLWVSDYWQQACQNTMSLLPLQWFGWNTDGETVTVEWESEENKVKIRTRVAFLTHGCGCKTGCTTKRCKCKKEGHLCGPGCVCTHCQNLETETGNNKLI